ncbi:MAG: efflux transporter outer membrane subunit [Phycisphaerales bacterium]|nr:efflux transporter outer membrane subunit [Phycisphaerales bacterium]
MSPNHFSCRMIGSLILALWLAGCKVGPNHVEPEVPVDAAFINVGTNDADQSEPVAEWWNVFNDPTLTSLVERAIAHNYDLRIAAANVRQARELLIEARFQLYPIVPGRAGYRHARLSEFSLLGSGGERDFDVFTGGFDATWELDIFGGVRRAIESRDATVGAFEATGRDVLVSVEAEVARNYFELRGNQGRLAVARQNADNQQNTFNLTRTLLEGGRGTELDTSRARSQLESTLATIPPLETLIEQAIYRLGVLTGEQPAALVAELSPAAPLPEANQRLAIGTPAELIRRRPDVREAERSLAASTASIGVNTADLYPRITIDGSIGLESGRFGSGDFSGGADTYSIGPRVTWAAFDLGRVKARIRASEAQAEADLARFELTVLNALEEVDASLLAYGKELRRREHLVAAEEASRKASQLARQRFDDGVADFLDVLDAERTVLQTQDELAESATRAATLLVAVYKALGGGWELQD